MKINLNLQRTLSVDSRNGHKSASAGCQDDRQQGQCGLSLGKDLDYVPWMRLP